MKRESKMVEWAKGGRAIGTVLHPTRTHSSFLSSLYTERRAATLETTCDDQKNKHIQSEKVWAEAEGDERTHRTKRNRRSQKMLRVIDKRSDMIDLKNH